ncbi:MAG: hypothetical protein AABY22_36675 [Nanoarchaeota archaeon]
MKECKIPTKKRLIGHEKKGDIYETPRGQIWEYFGSKKGDFDNCKKWKKLT